jgi:hypothetical protein
MEYRISADDFFWFLFRTLHWQHIILRTYLEVEQTWLDRLEVLKKHCSE